MPDYAYQSLIRENLNQLEKQQKMNALSTSFFTHLFHLNPELADVLDGDVTMLHRKFANTMATLKTFVIWIKYPQRLKPWHCVTWVMVLKFSISQHFAKPY